MQIIATHMTVAEYCGGLSEGSIIVDRTYQRSNQVWPLTAQSFLIETILEGFPIPKLSLFQRTDRISRRTVKEIVDGQQRSEAIRRFFDGDLRLSRTIQLEAAKGRKYEQLEPDLQSQFLSYALGIDLFVEATDEDVREVFRRINSYDVPLSPEEQRHAQFQGEFKWYIYHLARALDRPFITMGAFTSRQMVRMIDMKLLTELTHALLNGISTTSKTSLRKVYEDFDVEFSQGEEFANKITEAVLRIYEWDELHSSSIMRTHVLYSLILALIHIEHPVPTLSSVGVGGRGLRARDEVVEELSQLADVIEQKETRSAHLKDFLRASIDRTNVADQRVTRVSYLVEALSK